MVRPEATQQDRLRPDVHVRLLGVTLQDAPVQHKLKLRHSSRTVNVKVIDRGPYAGDREFDLTEATRNKLDFGNTGTVLTTK